MRNKTTALLAITLALSMVACNYYPVETGSAAGPGDATPLSIEGSWSSDLADPGALGNSRGVLHNWLVSESANAGLTNPVEVTVTEAEMAEVNNAPDTGRLAVGLDKTVGAVVSFADLIPEQARQDGQTLSHGAVRFDGNHYIWTASVKSPGATGMRLHFTDFNLPRHAELFVYNQAGEVFGPYSNNGPLGTGEFWSHTVTGELVLVQLHHFGTAAELQSAGFTIQNVGHLGAKYLLPSRRLNNTKSFCSDNAECVVDASCYSNPSIDDAKNAIAHLVFLSRGRWYICSGGLLADTDVSSEVPYLLTANHCFSRDREAASLEAYFFYRTNQCGDLCNIDPYTEVPRTVGSTIKSTNKTGDYTLVELSEPAPAGAFFLGWDTTDIAYADGTELYRVAHPKGSPQAYSKHVVDSEFGYCSDWPLGSWIYSEDVEGATEGGSSGSPVLNASGQVVGQLSGGCGYNVSDACDAVQNRTVDGALASYFAEVEQFLAPAACIPEPEVCNDGVDNDCDDLVDCADEDCAGDPACLCTDADGDGYCESEDCNDNDPAVNPGAAEVCDDLVDNNCDGNVDEGCGTCAPAGDPCEANSDCCSGRCHPKKLVCK